MEMRNGKSEKVTFLIAASLLGAGAALLFAPQSGKKTRRDLRYLGKKVMNQVERIKLEAAHRMERLADDVLVTLQECIGQGRHWTDRCAKEFRRSLNSGKRHVSKESEKVLQAKA